MYHTMNAVTANRRQSMKTTVKFTKKNAQMEGQPRVLGSVKLVFAKHKFISKTTKL
jgi:hypothetical protein